MGVDQLDKKLAAEPEKEENTILFQSIEPQENSKLVVSSKFNSRQADQLLKDFYSVDNKKDEERLYYFTTAHIGSQSYMGMFGDFAPSIVYAANKFHNLHLPYRESYLQEFAYSKLLHLYCTLDRSIMFGYYNRHIAKSKVFNLNSVAAIMKHPELSLEYDHLEKKDVPDEELRATLFQVKLNATKLVKYVKTDFSGYKKKKATKHRLSYPGQLEDMFGKNLKGILLYGSSARGKGKDFDNVVVLKTLPKNLYEKIHMMKPDEKGKDVGHIFMPAHVVEKFLYINVSNTLFRDHAKVLHGEFKFPIDSERYKVFKEMYHAGFGSGKLISSMNLAYREPEIFFDKEGLFEYFMKLNRFSLHGLLQKDGYVTPEKEELMEILRDEYDFEVPEFRADKSYIQEWFLRANKASVALARKLYEPNLAKEEGEHLINIKGQIEEKIYTSEFYGRKLFIFQGKEPMKIKDYALVKVLKEGDTGHNNMMREVKYKELTTDDNYYVGRRL